MAAALTAAVCGLVAPATGLLGPLEDDAVDLRFELRPVEPPSDVAVVGIDDVTFDELERPWPLPRRMYAEVLERLEAAGARRVVIDVQFTEETNPRDDLALFDALGKVPGTILATSETDGRGGTRVLGGEQNLEQVDARAAAANIPDARGGVVRRFMPAVGGLGTIAAVTAARSGRPLPAGAYGRSGALIDYRGPPGTVPTISFSRVHRGHFDPAVVRGRIVVVGATSPTVQDVHPTPTTGGGSLMSGPEIQASAIWTALHGAPLRDAPPWAGILLVLLASVFPPLVAARWRVLVAALALPVIAFVLGAGAQIAFGTGLVVPLVPALLALTVAGLGTVVASHLGESRERRRALEVAQLLEVKVGERTRELFDAQREIVSRLGQAVEYRNQELGDHVDRMSMLCHRLAVASGIDTGFAELIRHASALHDVGKVGIPDSVLLKPGLLTDEERAVMQTHTSLGDRILAGSSVPLVQLGQDIALTHHERWDGEGYPARLAGEAIPLAGRIAAICDVYDALISERTYKRAWSPGEALAELVQQRGRGFDPGLTDAFVAMMAEQEGVVPHASTTFGSLVG